jgi:hypothetical protein
MQLANTIIGAAGDLLVLVALIVAVRALGTANGARADALNAENEAAAARKESVAREIDAQYRAMEEAKKGDERARDAAARERGAALREIEARKLAEQAAANADRRAREAAKRDEKAADRQVAIHRMTMLEWRRERVVQIGALVEQLFWLVEPSSRGETVAPQAWMPYRNHLGQLLVGLKDGLPTCASILNDAATSSVMEHSKNGRQEVEVELARIDEELRQIQFVTSISEILN